MVDLKKVNQINIKLKDSEKFLWGEVASIDNTIAELVNMTYTNEELKKYTNQIINNYILELKDLMKRNVKDSVIGGFKAMFVITIIAFLARHLTENSFQLKSMLLVLCGGIMISKPLTDIENSLKEYFSNQSEIKEIDSLDEKSLYTKGLKISGSKIEDLTNKKLNLLKLIKDLKSRIEITDKFINQDNEKSKEEIILINNDYIYDTEYVVDTLEMKVAEIEYSKTKKKII